uniref:Uncharacterized protein n=1 Tax=Ditylenchus dipsaci TaxID=166011 RepID=A0A915DWL1_9BILA
MVLGTTCGHQAIQAEQTELKYYHGGKLWEADSSALSTNILSRRSPLPTQATTLLNTSAEQEEKTTSRNDSKTRTVNEYNVTYTSSDQPPFSRPLSQAFNNQYSSLSRLSNGRNSPYNEEPSTFKLNVFDSGKPVELSIPIKKQEDKKSEYVLNDTTTTTTTLEVFRGKFGEDSVDFFKLPPEPFSRDGKAQLIRAHGPPYEASTRIDTTSKSNQPYFVTEPSNTSSLNRTYSRLQLEQQQSRPSSAYSTPGSSH